MRGMRASAVHVAFLSAVFVSGWSAVARAQLTPPPPMRSGGLAPPPKDTGPPPPPPSQAGPTQMALEAAGEQDSGRGLEFVYFDVEGGFEFAALDAITKSGTLVPDSSKTSAPGGLVGVGAGLRLLYFTVGPHFRFDHASDWDLWTLNLDLGWRVPLGRLEPHGHIGGGYAKLGHSADNLLGAARGVSVTGFDFRLGAGVDYYAANVFSIGATLDVELLRLARSAVVLQPTDPAGAAAFGSSASSLGVAVTAAAVVGLHF